MLNNKGSGGTGNYNGDKADKIVAGGSSGISNVPSFNFYGNVCMLFLTEQEVIIDKQLYR